MRAKKPKKKSRKKTASKRPFYPWFRLVKPPVEFTVQQATDGWFDVLRNGKVVWMHTRAGDTGVRFQHKQAADGFALACWILEQRF